jgi:hypothetical protein
VTQVPGFERPCVKVVFPLPNGNAQVFLKPETSADGSLTVTSSGRRFGDPGFYFTVHHGGKVWARYLRAMQGLRGRPGRASRSSDVAVARHVSASTIGSGPGLVRECRWPDTTHKSVSRA